MRHILIQPAAGRAAKNHFANTVATAIDLKSISQLLDDDKNRSLWTLYPDGLARVWGVTPAKDRSNIKTWQKIQAGDIVLFTGQKRAFALSSVTAKIHNRKLAEHLWKRQRDGQTWEYVYFLKGLAEANFAYSELNKQAHKNIDFQGVNLLDDVRSERICAFPPVAESISTLAEVEASPSTGVALPLTLFGRYGRTEVFATVGWQYDAQQQHLNTGLSPKCPDGG